MPLYDVQIREIETYFVEVEAEDEDAAAEKAEELINYEDGRYKHHHDSDTEIDVSLVTVNNP